MELLLHHYWVAAEELEDPVDTGLRLHKRRGGLGCWELYGRTYHLSVHRSIICPSSSQPSSNPHEVGIVSTETSCDELQRAFGKVDVKTIHENASDSPQAVGAE